jgi:hypothetical protein
MPRSAGPLIGAAITAVTLEITCGSSRTVSATPVAHHDHDA